MLLTHFVEKSLLECFSLYSKNWFTLCEVNTSESELKFN